MHGGALGERKPHADARHSSERIVAAMPESQMQTGRSREEKIVQEGFAIPIEGGFEYELRRYSRFAICVKHEQTAKMQRRDAIECEIVVTDQSAARRRRHGWIGVGAQKGFQFVGRA